ncbi:unnamed protein product [Rhizoctonia solani]|uniref:DUF6535 domain-containing protein n=1 Tax=Rhizoctonia solani TaxID=456999 RepID=A0A8H3H091_9AGAM|nr:unnamed protein product [Rhizoctonia solani]
MGLGFDGVMEQEHGFDPMYVQALFSAVVTAFLIESYQDLSPNYEKITADGMIALIDLTRVIASGKIVVDTTERSPIPPNSDFKPTKTSIIVNTLWFSSLTLSITTALLTLLVKQWTEGYLFGHGLTTPCIQARIRQSRYDKLRSWKTEEIVLALPIIMHAALWLFLLGLLIFLGDLHPTVLAPVMVFVMITLLLYLATSLAPLAFAFCPYNTPLSGRRLWGFCYWLFHQADSEDKDFSIPPCQKKEKTVSESTIPDSLTARAVEWLVAHSRDQKSIDIAIRAISSPMLEVQVWKNLAQGSLLALISQRFTSILSGNSFKYGIHQSGTKEAHEAIGKELIDASLYARALANVVKYASLAPVSGTRIPLPNAESSLVDLSKEQIAAVEHGLRQLALNEWTLTTIDQETRSLQGPTLNEQAPPRLQNSPKSQIHTLTEPLETSAPPENVPSPTGSTSSLTIDNIIAAAGITSLSAWYTAVGRINQTQQEWKDMLLKAVAILRSTSQVDCTEESQDNQLDDDTMVALAKTLPVEISHWRWDLTREESAKVLRELVDLFGSDLLSQNREGPTRGGLSAAIAVLAIMVNDYSDPESFCKPVQFGSRATEYDSDIASLYQLSQDAYNQVQSTKNQSQKARRRLWRAQWMASICMADSKYVQKHSDAMLLLGIAGLLESFMVLGLRTSAPHIARMAFDRLAGLPAMTQSRPMTLPFVLPPTFDIKSYAVDIITRIIYTPTAQLNPFDTEDRALLLQCLSKNKQLWIDFGSQLLLPVLGLFSTTEEHHLQSQCLDALDEYWHTNPTPIATQAGRFPASCNFTQHWKMFFDYNIPHKLVRLVSEGGQVRPKAISSFRALTQTIPTKPVADELESREASDEAKNYLISVLAALALDGLLPVLAKYIVFEHGGNLTVWWKQILALPSVLRLREDVNEPRIRVALQELCNDPELKGVGELVASSLRGEIVIQRRVESLQLAHSVGLIRLTSVAMPRRAGKLPKLQVHE